MKIADTFIRLKQVVMTSSGTCLFLGNDQKTFIIYVDPVMGEQIRFASSKQAPSRPLTFDFMRYLLFGLDVSVRHIVLYRAEKETFFAKVICQQSYGPLTHLTELDVRPSDAVLLSLATSKPIAIDSGLFQSLSDAGDLLENFLKMKE